MGKKGKEMREQKAAAVKYSFTMEQLRERDRQTIERFRKQVTADCRAELQERVDAESKRLEQQLEENKNATMNMWKRNGKRGKKCSKMLARYLN